VVACDRQARRFPFLYFPSLPHRSQIVQKPFAAIQALNHGWLSQSGKRTTVVLMVTTYKKEKMFPQRTFHSMPLPFFLLNDLG
jgi:hypothetical protein